MTFRNWYYRDAAWWEFWMPQSGPVGGTILVIVTLIPLFLLMKLLLSYYP